MQACVSLINRWNWFRRRAIFTYFRDYFPSNLIKTADLPANANYLFISYPHGVISYNTLSCFGSEANKIETEVFPGIDFHFVTLDINFHSPFTREYFMSLGWCRITNLVVIYFNKQCSARIFNTLLFPIQEVLAQKNPVQNMY